MIDAVTLENVSDSNLPLNNNGTLSFWSPGVAHLKYAEAGLWIDSIERQTRTYGNGRYIVEYLVITSTKD